MGFTTAVQALGGTVVVMEKFDPEAYLALIERNKVTLTQVVPTMFVRLLKLPEEVRTRHDYSSLKAMIHAAAPCPVPVKQAMIAWLGPVIEEFYAGTEGGGFCVVSSAEWLARPGTVGRNIMGDIHICDDDGNELPVGEIGTIYFSGGNGFAYHNAPEKTASAHNPLHASWTTMGDVGRVDTEGYLFLSDRKDFMIIAGGVNIYPQEVENLLVTHPKVADVAVFGVPNADFGEEVKAVIQPARWEDAGDALGAGADRLVPRATGRCEVPADDRFRGATAARRDWQALQERAQGALLAVGMNLLPLGALQFDILQQAPYGSVQCVQGFAFDRSVGFDQQQAQPVVLGVKLADPEAGVGG